MTPGLKPERAPDNFELHQPAIFVTERQRVALHRWHFVTRIGAFGAGARHVTRYLKMTCDNLRYVQAHFANESKYDKCGEHIAVARP